jgi:di/tricarboxylate transporter
MNPEAIMVLVITGIAVILFATEKLPIDLVAILIMISLVLTGIISPQEGVNGFSNTATITVAFMFVLSAALLKSGALQNLAPRMAHTFRYNFRLGIILMMLLIAFASAFINNTPIVAIMIPVMLQIASSAGISPGKVLIPVSFASIFGGTCSLIGTSTNILVSGIVERYQLEPISMFQMTPMGLIFLAAGIIYMILIGIKLLPDRNEQKDLNQKFGLRDYLMEIVLLENASSVGARIMDSPLVKELEMDILEIRRNGSRFTVPPGDFILYANDILKIRCNIEKLRQLKDRVKIELKPSIMIGEDDFKGLNTSLVEFVVVPNSEFSGKTLRQLDFRRKYRAIPLAIRHREEILHEHLHDVPLQAGDVLLAEVKSHYVDNLKNVEKQQRSPFIILSEEGLISFDRRTFWISFGIITGVIVMATLELIPIMMGTILGSALLVLTNCLKMKELYEAIHWRVIFLLAGALSLGVAMENSGLDQHIADLISDNLGSLGPVAVVSGLYLATSLLTETMSNNATAALLTPIAIATAERMGVSYVPMVMAVTFAASASFMTPVGYQTNTMIYTAGQYRFMDFVRIGFWLNLLFWILATLLIPLIFPF